MSKSVRVKFCGFIRQILASEMIDIELSEKGNNRLSNIMVKLEQHVNSDKIKLASNIQSLSTQYGSYAVCVALNGMLVDLSDGEDRTVKKGDQITLFAPVEGG